MSIQLDGTGDFYNLGSLTENWSSWTALVWFKRDADTGGREIPVDVFESSNAKRLEINGGSGDDDAMMRWGATTSASFGPDLAVDTWWAMYLRYTGLGGSDFEAGILQDGDTSWTYEQAVEATADQDIDDIIIGAGDGGANSFIEGKIYCARIWKEDALDNTALLAEKNSPTAVQTADLFAEYRFEEGALTTDSSGNGRTLTENGDPVFSSDAPTDVSAASTALPLVNAMLLAAR